MFPEPLVLLLAVQVILLPAMHDERLIFTGSPLQTVSDDGLAVITGVGFMVIDLAANKAVFPQASVITGAGTVSGCVTPQVAGHPGMVRVAVKLRRFKLQGKVLVSVTGVASQGCVRVMGGTP